MGQSLKNARVRRGFTLVELLVVIGIIGVMVAILLPSLNRTRESAKRVACASLLRQIGLAARSYAAENRDSLPPLNGDLGATTFDANGNIQRMLNYICWGSKTGTSAGQVSSSTGEGVSFDPVAAKTLTVGSNLGRYCALGYLKGDPRKMTACPATDIGADMSNNADPNRYYFQVHLAIRDAGAAKVLQPWWKKLSAYGKAKNGVQGIGAYSNTPVYAPGTWAFGRDLALGADALGFANGTTGNQGYAAHNMGSTRAFNLLFADGSVKTGIVPNTLSRQNSLSYSAMLDQVGWAECAASGTPFMKVVNNKYAEITGYNP